MLIRTKTNAIYYGGTVMEKKDKNDKPTGEYGSYLSFVQVNEEKNKMEQVLVTYEGDIRVNGKDGTIKGAGLIAGKDYIIEIGINTTNEKDKDGNQKAVRHILYGFTPVTASTHQTKI